MSRQAIVTDKIAAPIGPFPIGVRAGGFVFLSGQIALDPASGKLTAGDVGAQTEQILRNIGAVLDASGKSFADIVKTAVFLADMKDFAAMNVIYERYFEAPFPARTTIAVAGLPLGAAVEIEALIGP
jgi:2-iminobutanoate/2-iminopropanoate deaminase